LNIIQNIRKTYSGALTYSANWGGFDFAEEADHIEFWSALDYIGLSAYYPLALEGEVCSVDTMKQAWEKWNTTKIKPLSDKFQKPILFTEVGYRSVANSCKTPWDFQIDAASDQDIQANEYEALLSYWSTMPYMRGIYFWNWQTEPEANPLQSTDYSIQNKKAESIMMAWFTRDQGIKIPSNYQSLLTYYGLKSEISVTLSPGQEGIEIINLQHFLNITGFTISDPVTHKPIETGNYGLSTKNAVLEFQNYFNINTKNVFGADKPGVVGPLTRAKINQILGSSN
jgi:hypothetical protein